MELVNDIYWAVPIKEVLEGLEDCQKGKFESFVKRHYLPATEAGELAIYKTDLDKFYRQFGYHYWDRLYEDGRWV